jgi:MerR family mercuric resistance operon transcriptional regulator
MRIGEVAEKAGVNVQTLRYYERRGLLDPPPRTPSGYRIYPMETVKLVRFIKRIQELGFSLTDVEDILSLRGDIESTGARLIASEKLAGVRARMNHLKTMDEALTHMLTSCSNDCTQGCDLDELLIDALN